MVVGWRCAVAAPVPAVLPACRSVGVWPRPVRLGSPGRWAAGCAHGAQHKIAPSGTFKLVYFFISNMTKIIDEMMPAKKPNIR